MSVLTWFKRSLWTHEQIILLLLGVLVGILGGYGAVAFRWLIDFLRKICYGPDANLITVLAGHTWYYRLLVPMIGGALVGLMIHLFAREAKGHGVPEVMEAVAVRSGVIRKRVVVIKSLASSLSIAVGGSVGREGPIVQIGSAIGSTVGQFLKASPGRMRVLVGCGAAAGIAATFNAPVAGMMFALEIILGEFSVATFSPIVLSAVMATAVSRFHLGNFPAFVVPAYKLVSPVEFGFYAILGLAAGVVAVIFTISLYKMEDLFDAWPFPAWLKTAATGAALGALGLVLPMVLGVGYEAIELALQDKLVWWMLLAVLGVKIFATSITIGGGMSGGIFAPSLFMGAMLGAAFGSLVHGLFPGITAGPGAYAIVGMAAVVAGTTHGPLTAFLILFELTGGYQIILPLMIGCVLATVVARLLKRESIYTLKLLRRGVEVEAGKEMSLLRSMRVGEAMRRDVDSVPRNMTLGQFHDKVTGSKHASFPVVNEKGEVVGVISHADYVGYHTDRHLWDLVVVMEMASPDVVTVTPQDTLEDALRKISVRDYATLPVVAGPGDRRLVGIISHRDIISVYSRRLRKSTLEQTGS
ncbi:MAG: chloride channel protein [Proteobacteria bacterium]|nr:chloride channel protein [Pseudomonadota bacterium]MBU1740842.1 chloride channel protein [Pseudomonadota bacterium]